MTITSQEIRGLLAEAERLAARAVASHVPKRIAIEPTSDADRVRAEVRPPLEADGFVLLDATALAGDAAGVAALVRRVVSKDPAPADTVEIVEPGPNAETYASSCTAQPLHTDRGYAATTPALVTMSCEVAATSGGLTQIVSAGAVHDHLVGALGDVDELFAPDAIRIEKRGKWLSRPLLERRAGGRVALSFSPFVGTIEASRAVEEAVRRIMAFIADVEHQLVFRLEPGHVLLLDNAAVLHGRTAFDDGERRRLSRAWYYDPHPAFARLGFAGAA